MVNLVAIALVAFALALLVLAITDFIRSRQPRALIPAAVGLLLLLLLGFFASRFALGALGTLPFTLDLPQFVVGDLVPLAVALVGVACAVGILHLARRRPILALGLTVLVALGLLGGMYWTSHSAALAAQTETAETAHPTLADIRVPKGFHVETFASDLQEPNALVFDDAGNLYYTELVDGNVVRLSDTNGDGKADAKTVFASGFKNPRGLAWRDGTLYVSSRGQINTLRDTNGDGVADENKVILDGLFSLDIQHSNNGLAFGPDGKLYIAIGGPRVGQLELKDETYWYKGQPRDDWQFGGVLVADPDGKNVKLYARGLRNPYGLAFDADGKLYATDNGDETIPVPDGDELNRIEAGGDYGYPYFFGIPPPWSSTIAPLIRFIPHAAPTGVTVYEPPPNATTQPFPEAYKGNVFVALYWHGRPGAHFREVVRALPGGKGDNAGWRLRAFADGLDHPTAVVVGPDGALYVADMRGGKADPDAPGAIYRIVYQGE